MGLHKACIEKRLCNAASRDFTKSLYRRSFAMEASQSTYGEGALLNSHDFMKPSYTHGCHLGYVTYLTFMTQEFSKNQYQSGS